MKKKLAVLMALACAAALTACGGSSSGSSAEPAESAAASVETSVESAVESATDSVVSTEPGTIDESQAISYDEFMALEFDEPVIISTYVQAKQAWWDNKATLYTQTPEGAYFIYEMPMTEVEYEALVPGTKILVSGTKAEWSGEIEIQDAIYELGDSSDTYIAEPVDITEMLGTDDLIKYQNQYISVKDMKIMAADDAADNDAAFIYNYNGSGTDGDDLYFKVSKGGENDPIYTFTVESYLTGPGTDVYEAVKNLKIGDTVDMEGYLYWYEGANPHITSVTVK